MIHNILSNKNLSIPNNSFLKPVVIHVSDNTNSDASVLSRDSDILQVSLSCASSYYLTLLVCICDKDNTCLIIFIFTLF
jgi:hypothetical protein